MKMGIGKNITACVVFLAFCLMAPDAVRAQGKQSLSVHYGITFPTGGGFIGGAGFADLSVEYGIRLNRMLSAGLSAGYGYDRRQGLTTDRYNGDLVNGFSDRNLTVVPMHVWLRYFPWKQQSRWQPYIMLGAGVQYARFDIRGDQIDSRSKGTWGVSISPQLGTRFFPWAGNRIFFDGRVSWRYSANEWEVFNIDSIRRLCVSLGAGVAF